MMKKEKKKGEEKKDWRGDVDESEEDEDKRKKEGEFKTHKLILNFKNFFLWTPAQM